MSADDKLETPTGDAAEVWLREQNRQKKIRKKIERSEWPTGEAADIWLRTGEYPKAPKEVEKREIARKIAREEEDIVDLIKKFPKEPGKGPYPVNEKKIGSSSLVREATETGILIINFWGEDGEKFGAQVGISDLNGVWFSYDPYNNPLSAEIVGVKSDIKLELNFGSRAPIDQKSITYYFDQYGNFGKRYRANSEESNKPIPVSSKMMEDDFKLVQKVLPVLREKLQPNKPTQSSSVP